MRAARCSISQGRLLVIEAPRSQALGGALPFVARALLGLAFLLPFSSTAFAVHCAPVGNDCLAIMGTDLGSGNCELSTIFNCSADTTVNIPGNLTITAAGGINCSGDDGPTGAAGSPGFDLTLNIGGNLTVDGFIFADGGAGGAGAALGTGGPGGPGAPGGTVDIDVCGDATVSGFLTARGGAGALVALGQPPVTVAMVVPAPRQA